MSLSPLQRLQESAAVPPEPARRRRPPVLVALGVVSSCALMGSTFAVLARSSWDAVREPGPDSPADILAAVLASAGALLVVWLGVGAAAAVLAVRPGAIGTAAEAVADRLAPAAVRRAAAVLLGTALTASLVPGAAVGAQRATASVAVAATGAPASDAAPPAPPTIPATLPPAPPASPSIPAELDPQFQATTRARPDLAAPMAAAGGTAYTPAPPRAPAGAADLGPLGRLPKPGTSVEEHIVVRRGDTLWDIAARHLPAGTTSAEVALEWPRWYAANRAVLGEDPDLIRPGTRLTPPTGSVP